MSRWYHQKLDSKGAERLLKEEGADGSYLVRPSASQPGKFSLSIRRDDVVTHIKIRPVGEFYTLQSDDRFPNLFELIDHYTKTPINEKSGSHFQLKQPLGPPNRITERWFHESIKSITAEKMIREHGLNGSFLVRESQSRIGDYVLTVRIKEDKLDQVTHVIIHNRDNKYDVGGGQQFDTLKELVEYYKRKPIVIEHSGQVLNMRFPFNSTRTTALDLDIRIRELSKENIENIPPSIAQNTPSQQNNIISNNNNTNTNNDNYNYNQSECEANSLISGKDGFVEEFEHLQHQECKMLYNRKVGQDDRNTPKNRYKNILPFDHTRVILKKPYSYQPFNNDNNINSHGDINHHQIHLVSSPRTPPVSINGSDQSDYINANYIKLVDSEEIHISEKTKPVPNSKCYIATQGPLANTVDDFWWMVWQERSECIVMATREVEREKNKCFRYWPTMQEKTISAGMLTVEILNDTSMLRINSDQGLNRSNIINGQTNMDYICREFEIRLNGTTLPESRLKKHRVKQYQYIAWPDQSIPENPSSVLTFIKLINRHGHPKGPMIVHCSAGMGRSGTLIVIDMLIDQLKTHGLNQELDIQRIVQLVRAQRFGLVQTVAQYRFIYYAIQSYIAGLKNTSSDLL